MQLVAIFARVRSFIGETRHLLEGQHRISPAVHAGSSHGPTERFEAIDRDESRESAVERHHRYANTRY